MQISLGTMLAQGIAFFIFVWVTMKFAWVPLSKAMEERRAKIAEGLAAAERGKSELADANARIQEIIQEARNQALEIVEQANRRAADIVDAARGEGERERQRKIDAAVAEIQQAESRARDELRADVARIAVAGAERILAREIDQAKHRELLDQLATQI